MASTLSDIPLSAVRILIYNLIIYFMSNLSRSAGGFFTYHLFVRDRSSLYDRDTHPILNLVLDILGFLDNAEPEDRHRNPRQEKIPDQGEVVLAQHDTSLLLLESFLGLEAGLLRVGDALVDVLNARAERCSACSQLYEWLQQQRAVRRVCSCASRPV